MIQSGLIDTEASVFHSVITILTIVLPIVGYKACPRLENLIIVLFRALIWDSIYPNMLKNIWNSTPANEEISLIDKEVFSQTILSSKRAVDQYFTVLHGMFPCNTITSLSHFSYTGEIPVTKSLQLLDKVTDSLEHHLPSINDHLMCKARIKELLVTHRMSVNLLSTPETEIEAPWFTNMESSEIIFSCFGQKISEVLQSDDVDSTYSLDDLSTSLLEINTKLHGNLLQAKETFENNINLSHQSQNTLAVLKIFYFILLNESFFKECMRQYHHMIIRRLRKSLIVLDTSRSDEIALTAKLLSKDEEISQLKMIISNQERNLSRAHEKQQVKSDNFAKDLDEIYNTLGKSEFETRELQIIVAEKMDMVFELETSLAQERVIALTLQLKAEIQELPEMQAVATEKSFQFVDTESEYLSGMETKVIDLETMVEALNFEILQNRIQFDEQIREDLCLSQEREITLGAEVEELVCLNVIVETRIKEE